MKKKSNTNVNRRKFLENSLLAATGLTLASQSLWAGPALLKQRPNRSSVIAGVRLGVITYSFRSMPDQSAEAILGYVTSSGLSEIELMGEPAEVFAGKPPSPVDRRALYGLRRTRREQGLSDNEQKELDEMQQRLEAYQKEVAEWRSTVSMEPFEELRDLYAAAGVRIYAFKPRAFGIDNTDAEIEWGMKAAKALGASHVTLEHPGDDRHTQKLGQMGAKNGIFVAYHGHEQQTPTFWDTALEQSTMNSLNLDLGHYIAAGNPDPLQLIRDKFYRIRSIHLKDRRSPDNGKDNVVWGSGDTPLGEALRLMQENGYEFPATIELEYDIPDGSDAVKEVRKCVEFCKNALG